MADTWLDIVTDALLEINAQAPGEPVDPAAQAIAQRRLNRIIDSWAARRAYAHAEVFTQYNLIPNLQPHSIGQAFSITATALTNNVATFTAANNFAVGDPVTVSGSTNGGGIFNVQNVPVIQASIGSFQVSLFGANVASAPELNAAAVLGPGPIPTFVSADRPPRIDGAALVLTDQTPNVDSPILNIRDADWWANNRVKSLATNVPTDLYPQYQAPLVNLFFWPVPNYAYAVRLRTRTVIQRVSDLTQVFLAPEGFNLALTLSLAELCCRPFGKPVPADLAAAARDARAVILRNNDKSPRVGSADFGTQSNSRGGFNYYTGM